MFCPICLEDVHDALLTKLHDTHEICIPCSDKLRQHRHTECPVCREPINQDLLETTPIHTRVISDIQIKSFNIPQSFINTISNRLPFYYTGRFEGASFMIDLKQEYEAWNIAQNNLVSNTIN